jgi:hypothetical protein
MKTSNNKKSNYKIVRSIVKWQGGQFWNRTFEDAEIPEDELMKIKYLLNKVVENPAITTAPPSNYL